MGTQRLWAQIIGVILILVGLLGFFMASPLLGVFHVNPTHNVVHLITGLIFCWAGFMKNAPTKKVNQWIGVIYIIVALLGFFGVLGFLDIMGAMDADNFLHLVIGVVSALIGWMSS